MFMNSVRVKVLKSSLVTDIIDYGFEIACDYERKRDASSSFGLSVKRVHVASKSMNDCLTLTNYYSNLLLQLS